MVPKLTSLLRVKTQRRSAETEEAIEEGAEPAKHGLLLRGVAAALTEPRHRREDLRDRGAGRLNRSVAEGRLDECVRCVRVEALLGDDPL